MTVLARLRRCLKRNYNAAFAAAALDLHSAGDQTRQQVATMAAERRAVLDRRRRRFLIASPRAAHLRHRPPTFPRHPQRTCDENAE